MKKYELAALSDSESEADDDSSSDEEEDSDKEGEEIEVDKELEDSMTTRKSRMMMTRSHSRRPLSASGTRGRPSLLMTIPVLDGCSPLILLFTQTRRPTGLQKITLPWKGSCSNSLLTHR